LRSQYLLFILLATLSAGTAFSGSLYTIEDATNSLYLVDQTTGATSLVGFTGISDGHYGDLSYNPIDGKLYWIPGRGDDSLYTLDPKTGQATLLGSHGIDDLFSLAWDTTNNILYAQAANGNFYSLDPTTGAPTWIGSNGIYPGGLVYNPMLDTLLLLQVGADYLYMVDPFTGSATQVAGGANPVNDNGVTYDPVTDGYWVSSYVGGLIQYDASFNQLAVFPQSGNFDGIAFVDDSIAQDPAPSAPEPATFLLIGTGLVGAAFYRRHRR